MVPSLLFAHAGLEEKIARLLIALETQPNDAELHVQLADVRCQHGEWTSALQELDRTDQLAPGKYATDLMRGEAFLAGQKPREAKRALDRFLASHADNPRALTLRARANDALENAVACMADYQAAWTATERPEPDFVQEYSNALATRGQLEKSLEILQAGIEKIGAVPGLVQLALDRETALGRFNAAVSRIDVLQKTAPRPEPWMAKRAGLLAQAGRFAESRAAWSALRDHLAALPNLDRGSHAMSILAEQAQQALAELNARSDEKLPLVAAPEIAAATPAVLSSANQVKIRAGSIHEEELTRANEQVAASPTDAKVWFERSGLLLLDGEFAAAIRDADEVERLAPGKFFTAFIRGRSLIGLGQLDEGRAVLDEFLEAHPDHAAGLVARATLWDQLEQPEKALTDYRRALQTTAEPQVDLVRESVEALVAHGYTDEAVRALDVALTRLGAVPALLQRSLELNTSVGRIDAALSRIAELQKLAPRPEPWIARRAVLLEQSGRADEARRAWQELITHIDSLPNLQRGMPQLLALTAQAKQALGAP